MFSTVLSSVAPGVVSMSRPIWVPEALFLTSMTSPSSMRSANQSAIASRTDPMRPRPGCISGGRCLTVCGLRFASSASSKVATLAGSTRTARQGRTISRSVSKPEISISPS